MVWWAPNACGGRGKVSFLGQAEETAQKETSVTGTPVCRSCPQLVIAVIALQNGPVAMGQKLPLAPLGGNLDVAYTSISEAVLSLR